MVLIVVVTVILVTITLSFSKDFTNKSLDKTKVVEDTKNLDTELFIYPKSLDAGIVQFNYSPPTTNTTENIVITKYKILTDNNESAEVTLDTNYTLKNGQNILNLDDFSSLDISNNKVNIQFYTSDGQYILLKNVSNFNVIAAEEVIITPVNLLVNGNGETGNFTGWTTSSLSCSGGWCIGGGMDSNYAFYSSYSVGMYMTQLVDLTSNSIQNYTPAYLDTTPPIEINDYIKTTWGGTYRIYVELRRADDSIITTYDTGTIIRADNNDWLRITNTFTGYGAGLRKIYFIHYGMDTRGWAGNYGTAFDDASVYVN